MDAINEKCTNILVEEKVENISDNISVLVPPLRENGCSAQIFGGDPEVIPNFQNLSIGGMSSLQTLQNNAEEIIPSFQNLAIGNNPQKYAGKPAWRTVASVLPSKVNERRVIRGGVVKRQESPKLNTTNGRSKVLPVIGALKKRRVQFSVKLETVYEIEETTEFNILNTVSEIIPQTRDFRLNEKRQRETQYRGKMGKYFGCKSNDEASMEK